MNTVPRSSLPAPGFVLLLNGCSSSGKTSLAKELQRVLPDSYLHVQLDSFRAMEPTDYFSRGNQDLAPLRIAALCRSMNATVLEYAKHGQNVILDHVLSAVAWTYLLEDLSCLPVLLIGVTCGLEELVRREQSRKDRKLGLANSQYEAMHQGRDYDHTVDTTNTPTAACVAQLQSWLQSGPLPRAFISMRAEMNAL